MLKRTAVALICAALGAGASVAVGACGEDRGEVEVEGGTTGTGGHTTGATTEGATTEDTTTAEGATTEGTTTEGAATEGTTTGG
jgi:hypothetical protein